MLCLIHCSILEKALNRIRICSLGLFCYSTVYRQINRLNLTDLNGVLIIIEHISGTSPEQ